MAFNKLPQTWFTGLTDDGTDITLPISSLPELTASEIDSSTGDIRKFLFAICEECWQNWNGLAVADRPAKMTITKNASCDVTTGLITNVYQFSFKTAIASQDVADEA